MRKLIQLSIATLLALAVCVGPAARTYASSFNQNYIIGDSAFNNANTMSAAQIDAWLNASFGANSCISTSHGFSALDPIGYNPTNGFLYGSSVSAGHVIYDAAQAFGINPQVLLTTLQKEQGLVSGASGCTSILRYAGATGYGCPDSGTTHSYSGVNLYSTNTVFDGNYNVVSPGNVVSAVSGTCVNSAIKVGFSQQVIRAAWLLEFGLQRSEGNINWAVIKGNWNNSDDPQTCYGGPMTQGTFQRCPSGGATFYDGYTTIDGTAVHMNNGATAALYWYTPHFSGNQHFYDIYVAWFGDPNTPCSGVGNVSAASGPKIIPYRYSGGPTNLAFTVQNNTGSTCAETHVWNPGYQTWMSHIATAMKSTNPANGTIVPLGVKHNGLAYVTYSGSNGAVEVHKFSSTLQTFPGFYDVATNLGGVNASTGTFVTGDFLRAGFDQMIYILYNGANGHAEIHMFNPTYQRAIGYYDVVTNLSGVSAASGTFVSGDFLGRGYDQLAYVTYTGSTGRAEVHLFDPSLRSAIGFYDVPTNLAGVDASAGAFVGGDFLGRGYDQLMFAAYNGSTGRVEVHTFSPDLTRATGTQDLPTNLAGFDPDL